MDIERHLRRTLPQQPWAEFVDSVPGGRAPNLSDIAGRWTEFEEVEITRERSVKQIVRRSKENGEARAYQAWVLGLMEEEEARYFSMLSLRHDVLLQLAVVPIVRELVEAVKEVVDHANQTAAAK